jgi:hypothetical protein
MALEEITNHGDLAVGLLLEQLKDEEKLEAFLRALVGPAQELEEVAHDLDTEMRLDNAVGEQLDMIGRIVNLLRGSLSDSEYRTRLRAHIRANRSEGTPDDLLEVLRLMVPTNGLSIEEYPIGAVMRIADALSEDPDAIVSELTRTRPSAVPLHLEYTVVDDTDTFQFASGDTEEADTAAGFADQGWVAVGAATGSGAYIVTSTDGTTWTQRSNPLDERLNAVASNRENVLIAVGTVIVAKPYAVRSIDYGVTWSQLTITDGSPYASLNGITYSPDLDLWVAVGGDLGPYASIYTSDDDGDTWTERSNPDDCDLYSVTWCPALSLFIAVGSDDGVDSYIITSPDGITWTERANPKAFDLRGVCWSEQLGLAVAVGQQDGVDSYIVTSPDGIVWTERANPQNKFMYGVVWSPLLELFLAIGSYGVDSYIITSPDGITWTEQTTPTTTNLFGIDVSGLGNVIAVGSHDGADATILLSDDGTTWTEQSNPSSYHLYGIAGMLQGGTWAHVKET